MDNKTINYKTIEEENDNSSNVTNHKVALAKLFAALSLVYNINNMKEMIYHDRSR